jgi:hypothetical protein
MTHADQIRAQLARSSAFVQRAADAADPATWHDSLIAGTYFAQSAIELMRETAKAGGLRCSRQAFDRLLADLVPRGRLLHALRIRDFHRWPILGLGYATLEHSIKLPPLGQATITLDPNPSAPAVNVTVSDGSRRFRFFFVGHGFVQDQLEPFAIRLDVLLSEQLARLETCVAAFERLVRLPDAA